MFAVWGRASEWHRLQCRLGNEPLDLGGISAVPETQRIQVSIEYACFQLLMQTVIMKAGVPPILQYLVVGQISIPGSHTWGFLHRCCNKKATRAPHIGSNYMGLYCDNRLLRGYPYKDKYRQISP